jgi:hypothetical protein
MIFAAEHVSLISGEPCAFWSVAESGQRVAREFCSRCGTPLFAYSGDGSAKAVKPGSLDHPDAFAPQAQIWTCSARQWMHLDPTLPRFGRNPSVGVEALVAVAKSMAARVGRKLRPS